MNCQIAAPHSEDDETMNFNDKVFIIIIIAFVLHLMSRTSRTEESCRMNSFIQKTQTSDYFSFFPSSD